MDELRLQMLASRSRPSQHHSARLPSSRPSHWTGQLLHALPHWHGTRWVPTPVCSPNLYPQHMENTRMSHFASELKFPPQINWSSCEDKLGPSRLFPPRGKLFLVPHGQKMHSNTNTDRNTQESVQTLAAFTLQMNLIPIQFHLKSNL